jgi:hypothetical protein
VFSHPLVTELLFSYAKQFLVQSLPADLQSLLDTYSSVFSAPQGLPSVLNCDH